MAGDSDDLWQALLQTGENLGTEEDYEHGYAREVRGDLQQYVAFEVSGEIYGLPITQVAEISKMLQSTPVPRTAEFLLGIGNIRGRVIPVLDLARRLRLNPRIPDAQTRVLIAAYGDELHGLVVDRVLGVVSIPPESLEDTPGGLAGARADFIRALARSDKGLMIIIELDEVLRPEDFVAPAFRERRRSG